MFRFWYRTGPHSGFSTGLAGLFLIGMLALIVWGALAVGFVAFIIILGGAIIGAQITNAIKRRRQARRACVNGEHYDDVGAHQGPRDESCQ